MSHVIKYDQKFHLISWRINHFINGPPSVINFNDILVDSDANNVQPVLYNLSSYFERTELSENFKFQQSFKFVNKIHPKF